MIPTVLIWLTFGISCVKINCFGRESSLCLGVHLSSVTAGRQSQDFPVSLKVLPPKPVHLNGAHRSSQAQSTLSFFPLKISCIPNSEVRYIGVQRKVCALLYWSIQSHLR